jgi:hypothetical protein
MALTAEQEKGVVAMLAAFQNGKRINELDAAKGALKDMRIEVMDETGETHSMELADAVAQAGNPIAGRYWNTANATPTAAGYYGSLQALRDLPAKLGLGRYLVTDDRKKRKLDPTDSTKYADGSPAALDGSQGQCMWCWNGFIANIFNEGGVQVKCITFDKPVGNGVSIRIPAGGTSWLGAGVMDRTNQQLCSVISNAEQFRGGGGSALNASSYTKAPKADAAQLTMLGMPATNISTTSFGTYARKRGEGWEANWFVAQFVVEFLFEVIMGTQNSQATFNADKDANGLYQGGFGTGGRRRRLLGGLQFARRDRRGHIQGFQGSCFLRTGSRGLWQSVALGSRPHYERWRRKERSVHFAFNVCSFRSLDNRRQNQSGGMPAF